MLRHILYIDFIKFLFYYFLTDLSLFLLRFL